MDSAPVIPTVTPTVIETGRNTLKFIMLIAPDIILWAWLFVFIFILAYWHKKGSDFDFRKACTDTKTGKISFEHLGQLVALFTSTLLLVHETTKGHLTEWLFTGYMVVWAGAAGWRKKLDTDVKKQEIVTSGDARSEVREEALKDK